MDQIGQKLTENYLVINKIECLFLEINLAAFITLCVVTIFSAILGFITGIYVHTNVTIIVILIAVVTSLFSKRINVPANCVQVIVFLGERLEVCIREGIYAKWIFNNPLISLFSEAIPVSRDADVYKYLSSGIIPLNEIIMGVWGDDKDGKQSVKCVALNGTPVAIMMSVGLQITDPLRVMLKGDAYLEFFTKTREALRDLTKNFNDTDMVSLTKVLEPLLKGQTLMVATTVKGGQSFSKGDIVREKGGALSLKVLADEKSAKEHLEEFTHDVRNAGDKEYIEAATSSSGNLNIRLITLEKSLLDTAEEMGFRLYSVIFADIKQSAERMEMIQKLANETEERSSEIQTIGVITDNSEKLIEKTGVSPDIAVAVASAVSNVYGVRTVAVSNNSNNDKGIRRAVTNGIVEGNITSDAIREDKAEK